MHYMYFHQAACSQSYSVHHCNFKFSVRLILHFKTYCWPGGVLRFFLLGSQWLLSDHPSSGTCCGHFPRSAAQWQRCSTNSNMLRRTHLHKHILCRTDLDRNTCTCPTHVSRISSLLLKNSLTLDNLDTCTRYRNDRHGRLHEFFQVRAVEVFRRGLPSHFSISRGRINPNVLSPQCLKMKIFRPGAHGALPTPMNTSDFI